MCKESVTDRQPLQSRRDVLRGALMLALASALEACGGTAPAPPASPISPLTSPGPTLPPQVSPEAAQPARFDGVLAMEHAAAQMRFGPRDTGSLGWRACGDYIAAQLTTQKWTVEEQSFDYRGIGCRNIIGKRGNGPLIILGAHYDSRRRADKDPDPAKRIKPVPAANDGASGIAVLLELARVLQPETIGHTIWLAAFDAEDNGELDGWDWIIGSSYLAANLTITPKAVVVVDMIGDADQQIYYESNSDPSFQKAIWAVAGDLGYRSFVPQQRYAMLDDHTPFLRRGFRAVDIIDFDYPYWHTTDDTLDKISAASLDAVGRTLAEWLGRGAPEAPVSPTPAVPPAYGYPG